jgi:protoporphyrinogen oxidase
MTKDDIVRMGKEAGLELIHGNFMTEAQEKFSNLVAAFAAPPKRQPLTDEQREEIVEWLGHDVSSQVFYAIEAAHNIGENT